MTIVTLNASHDTMDAINSALQQQLNLPPHFGRNLDALYDALTADVPGPVENKKNLNAVIIFLFLFRNFSHVL